MMLIGLVVRTLTITNPPRAMLCSSVITLSPGPPRVRTSSLDQVLKPSIVQWLMVLLRPFGCASSCRSFMPLFAVPQWYTATTSVQSTCPPTLFSISAPNTSRLTSTSFKSELLVVTYVSCMCQIRLNTQTSSPKAFLLQCSRSSGPV